MQPNPDVDSRPFVVTGGTSGIGLEVARGLVRAGKHTVIVGRDEDKTRRAAEQLRSSDPNARVDYLVADLSTLAGPRSLASTLASRFDRIGGLVNNAGAVFARRQESADGVELTFALNVLAPFVLTERLMGRLASGAPARVVNISSDAHKSGHLDFDDLESRKKYSGFGVYSNSKLALVMLTYEFARHADPRVVSVNAVHPGFVRTRFGQNNGGGFALAVRAAGVFAINAEAGARTPLYALLSPEVAGVTGRYFYKEKATPTLPESYDAAAAARLWAWCETRSGSNGGATPP